MKGTRVSLSFEPWLLKAQGLRRPSGGPQRNYEPSQIIPLGDVLNVRNHALSPLSYVMIRATIQTRDMSVCTTHLRHTPPLYAPHILSPFLINMKGYQEAGALD